MDTQKLEQLEIRHSGLKRANYHDETFADADKLEAEWDRITESKSPETACHEAIKKVVRKIESLDSKIIEKAIEYERFRVSKPPSMRDRASRNSKYKDLSPALRAFRWELAERGIRFEEAKRDRALLVDLLQFLRVKAIASRFEVPAMPDECLERYPSAKPASQEKSAEPVFFEDDYQSVWIGEKRFRLNPRQAMFIAILDKLEPDSSIHYRRAFDIIGIEDENITNPYQLFHRGGEGGKKVYQPLIEKVGHGHYRLRRT